MRIYLKMMDIQMLRGCSRSSASRYISEIKFHVGKQAWQKITIYDYCKVEQVEVDDIKKVVDLTDPLDKFRKVKAAA